MLNNNNLNNKIIEPCFYSCANIVTEVNSQFVDFAGFSSDELLGKSLHVIGEMLKITSQISLNNICSNYSGYIFTKSLETIDVMISLLHNTKTNKQKYTFIEKPNSRLTDKLIFIEQTFINDISAVSVYSVPDLIILKTNQKYLDFQDSPFNKAQNILGKPIFETITDFAGGRGEAIFETVLETQETQYIKDLRYDKFARGITYWDFVLSPIFQSGKMKYIFVTTSEVTERFLNNQSIEVQNKIIQQQKKQLEQQNIQLEQRNTQLMSIVENLSEGIVLNDYKGKIIMANPEAKRLVYQSDKGMTIDQELKSTKFFNMEGNEIPLENFPVKRALRGEKVNLANVFISHPNKRYFAEVSAIPIYNASEDLTLVISCFRDTTKIIEQYRKIEEQKKQSEAIIENIDEGISIFDSKGQYTSFNKSARKMFFPSCKCQDDISDWYKEAKFYDIYGDKIDSDNIPSLRVMRGEEFKNERMVVKLPHRTLELDVSVTPIYDSFGKFTSGVLSSRDITDSCRHEEAIRRRYEILNRIVDTFDLPLVRLSCPDLKIIDINKKAFTILKLIKPNLISIKNIKNNMLKDLFGLLDTNEYSQCISEALKEKKTKYLYKKKYVINENEVFWNIIFEPVLEVNGEIQELVILIVDVTPEIKSNIVMEKALKLQGEFLVNISHELKTPLNIIFATAQLFNMYCTSGSLDENKDSIIKYIDCIKQNSYRLSKMINNIVDLSKIEAGFFKLNLSNNNIVEFVEDIVMSVTNFTDSKGLNIIFDTNIEEKIIACDTEKIERVVLNLISNAIKFTDKGDEILVTVVDKGAFVDISVQDNGIGIENKYLDMIFDRFKQVDKSLSRNAEGTGIGLSLVKSIVELHGGSIHVESEFGKGSKFTVILPSFKVLKEDALYDSEVRSEDQSIRVELSDVYS